jgi:spore coat protein CotH
MQMKRKKILFIGILLIIGMAVSIMVLLFHPDRNQTESTSQKDQEDEKKDDLSPASDYAKLDLVLENVPDYYPIIVDKSTAGYLGKLLGYVKENRNTMNRQTLNACAREISRIISSACTYTDVPQIYISGDYLYSGYSPASIAVVDSQEGGSKVITDTSAEIKIRGNSSREVKKKSYTFKLSKKEDILGMGKAKKWVLTANAFDKTLMRNKLVYDFWAAIGMEGTPEAAYVDVWLNGKYIGNYLLSEVIEASPSRVDINTDKGDFLIEREVERFSTGTTYFRTPVYGLRFGVNEPKVITDEQLKELTDFLGKVETAIQAGDWQLFTSYVDVKSYIDNYILSELFKVVDFGYSSTRFYIKDDKLYAGPPWDNDLSSGNADSDFYYSYNYHEGYGPDSSYIGIWCNVDLYNRCYEFPEFTEALHNRYQELQEIITNLYENNSLGTNQIDLFLQKYGKSFDRNYTVAGWTLKKEFILERNPEATFGQNVEYLRDWLKRFRRMIKADSQSPEST